jgi:eukaryotic-like serine/threonine-protein kinase
VRSAESSTKAWSLRNRVSQREKFFIEFCYDRNVTGNLEKAYQTLELWFQTYTRAEQPNPHSLLRGISTHWTARYERAIEASQKEIAVDPDFAIAHGNLAASYFLTGKFEEARKTIQAASERKLEIPPLLVIGYNMAVCRAAICRSGGRIPEDSRQSRYRSHRSHRRFGTPATREGIRVVGRPDQGEGCL